ncbi:hypothetical protein [Vulcanisaeta distributa]|uniref:Uncharacterized protein n=1 Tax=Vulcanisaeta distributa (strain DSM 14429 / JCM 11212 / NBRC 100878 / IC-017) TaxID=572478 RepID=E1QPQ6_VULDI|nr:hypothetical protein [Vulcanisaeta distributa]ADN50352.1 hypothetical protein Vdis_0962 [Vulcanisaeta distributa DSM 14429]
MLVLLFSTVEDAINKLNIIKEQLSTLRERYGVIREKLKINADVEEKLMKLGFQPSHQVITVQAIPHALNIHIAPHSTWLLNKLNAINDNINYVIGQIEKVSKYLSEIKDRNASVMVMIDYANKKTRLVIMP